MVHDHPGDAGDPPTAEAVQFAADDPFAFHLLPAQDVSRVAAAGTRGPGQSLPHGGAIQASFGRHDVSGVRAHVGGDAAEAATAMGARAFASGNSVAFAESPDLHTAAHEAAHVVQQRAGVQLYGGVGEAGDRYEQNADAVADAVVRGDSAEALLDGMTGAGGGAGEAAVQRQQGGAPGRGRAPGRRGTTVTSAAEALREAVEMAQLGLHARKDFIDGDIVTVKGAVKALEDTLHTNGGALAKADAKAVDKAMSAAYSLANALTLGEHARPKLAHQLRVELAGLQKIIDDPRNDEPARTPAELIPVAAESLTKLRVARIQVAERILDYPSADLHSLDRAIAETTDWVVDLSGSDGANAAPRLTRAVMDQAEVLAKVVPELESFLLQPLTESSDQVVLGFVLALAHSTERSTRAHRTAEIAKRTRSRQRFDAPREVIDGSDESVAALGQFDKREGRQARREQDRLEARVKQLDDRAKHGGKVSNLERDELLVEAREHDYRTHMRVLELQLRDTANGLDQLDDGFTGGINRYSDKIPKLVSDLRGLSRVAAAALSGYQERVQLIEQAAAGIDDESKRRREIAADKMAALDFMASFTADHLDNSRIEKRLDEALAAAEKAQTRLFLANVLTTIAMTLAGNLAASAARGAAEGAWLARAGVAGTDALKAAQTARIVGTATYAVTDVMLNTVGQKYALGDKRSFIDVMSVNALTALAGAAMNRYFVKIEHLVDDVASTASRWAKLATHGKKFAVALPELTMNMITMAALDHAYSVARGYETPPADPDAMVSQWMVQGAAIAIGRHITVHSKAFRTLAGRLQGGARKHSHALVLAMDMDVRAAGVMRTGDIAHAQALLAQYETLLAIERAMVTSELEDAHPNRRPADDTLEDAEPPKTRAADDATDSEPLPRTKPDRDPNSTEGLRENAAAIAAGEPGYNSVVGHVGSEAEGVAIMQRLMRGDVTALAELGYASKGKFDPGTREWGLGKIGKKFVIVAGEHAAVDWSAVAGVEPVGHSHPIDEGRIASHRSKRLDIRQLVSNAERFEKDAALVFSSPADIQFAALRRLAQHSIALPYEHLGGTDITLASQQPSGRPQLVMVLEDATYLGTGIDEGAMRYRTRAVVRAGDEVIWQGTIDAVFPPGKAARLEFDAPLKAIDDAEPPPDTAVTTTTKSEATDASTTDHHERAGGRSGAHGPMRTGGRNGVDPDAGEDFMTDQHAPPEVLIARDQIPPGNDVRVAFDAKQAFRGLVRDMLARRSTELEAVVANVRSVPALRAATKDVIGEVFDYLFDSQGIRLEYSNYAAWRRLAIGTSRIDDIRFLVHEIEELHHLRGAGLSDPTSRDVTPDDLRGWREAFDERYPAAHRAALEAELDYMASEIGRVTKGAVRLTKEEVVVSPENQDTRAHENRVVRAHEFRIKQRARRAQRGARRDVRWASAS